MSEQNYYQKAAIVGLLNRIAELERENEILRINSNYGTLTRQALEIDGRRLPAGVHVVMIDIDHLHELNAAHGSQEPVNEMIRHAFDFRHGDLLLKANYASGDEVAFIVRADPEGFMARLQESLAGVGMSATMAAEQVGAGEDILDTCARAMERVYAMKAERDRGGRFDG